MHNRKFDIKKDFHELNEMENKILPMFDEIKDVDKRELLKDYVRSSFYKQFKK